MAHKSFFVIGEKTKGKTIESLLDIKESFIPSRETCFVIFLCDFSMCICFSFQTQGTSSLENQGISK